MHDKIPSYKQRVCVTLGDFSEKIIREDYLCTDIWT